MSKAVIQLVSVACAISAVVLLNGCDSRSQALQPAADTATDPGAPPRTGEPGGPGGPGGGAPSGNVTLAAQILSQGDDNKDDALSADELTKLTGRWYDALVASGDELTQESFTKQYRSVLDPTPVGSGVMAAMQNSSGPATALFSAADLDKNGVLTRDELTKSFSDWFATWGGSATRSLTRAQIEAGLNAVIPLVGTGLFGGPPPGALPQQDLSNVDFAAKPAVTALSPAEEQKRLHLPAGYHLELVLAEPAVEDPMAIAFDGNGRMYVLEERTYMRDINGKGTLLPKSRISVHEDKDGDGVYETHGVFLDNIVFPRFVLPLDKGVILTMESNSTDVYKYTDTDGDGVADNKELFATQMNRTDANVEHMSSSLFWAMDNHLYISASGTRLRITPEKVERESISPNMGQWGISQDNYGRLFFQGGEIGVPVQFQTVPAYGSFVIDNSFEKGYTEPWGLPAPGDFQGGPSYLKADGSLKRVTGAAGSQVFRGDRLPKDLIGDYISGEPVARIVRRSKIIDQAGMTQLRNVYQAQKSEFIRSNDPLFRPLDMQTAPDGTLYIVDAYRGIIQESQWTAEGTYLRKKIQQYSLDKNVAHGRIWRLVYDGIKRDTSQPHMLDQTSAQLIPYLAHPNGWWRDQAQKLIVLRQDKSVVPALTKLAQTSTEVGRIHALWTLEGLNAASPQLLRSALADKNPRIRAAAIRVSESLYKAGDKSFATDLTKLARTDSDEKVVIQAMLSLNYLHVPNTENVVRLITAGNAGAGVREFGGQILSPRAPTMMLDAASQFASFTEAERKVLERGQAIYAGLCVTCHAADGKGTPVPDTTAKMGASFVNSLTVQGDPTYAINALLHGLSGSKADGKTYLGTMVGLGATNSDQWIADVLSYLRNSFGNAASFVTAEEVAQMRADTKARAQAWPIAELLQASRNILSYDPNWKLTASSNPAMAGYAINAAGTVSWSTGQPQTAGQWFAIEFPQATNVSGIEMIAPLAGRGYPRKFKIEISTDGNTWKAVSAAKANSFAVRVEFPAVLTKFLRVSLEQPDESAPAWSMQKLRVFAPPAVALANNR